MDIKEINSLYLGDYLKRYHNIDIDAHKNYQCFNSAGHKNGDKHPSMRIRPKSTKVTLFYLRRKIRHTRPCKARLQYNG